MLRLTMVAILLMMRVVMVVEKRRVRGVRKSKRRRVIAREKVYRRQTDRSSRCGGGGGRNVGHSRLAAAERKPWMCNEHEDTTSPAFIDLGFGEQLQSENVRCCEQETCGIYGWTGMRSANRHLCHWLTSVLATRVRPVMYIRGSVGNGSTCGPRVE